MLTCLLAPELIPESSEKEVLLTRELQIRDLQQRAWTVSSTYQEILFSSHLCHLVLCCGIVDSKTLSKSSFQVSRSKASSPDHLVRTTHAFLRNS